MIMQPPQKIIYSPKIIIPCRNPSLVRINIRISYSSIQKCDYLLFTLDIKNSIWSQKGGKNNHWFKILVLVVFRSAVCFHIFVKISKYSWVIQIGMELILCIVVVSLIGIIFLSPLLRPICHFTVCSGSIRTRIVSGFGGISADISAKSRFLLYCRGDQNLRFWKTCMWMSKTRVILYYILSCSLVFRSDFHNKWISR